MVLKSLRMLLVALTFCTVTGPLWAQNTVTVFAAASLKTALDEVAARFADMTGTPVNVSYAGSSALARQIQYGAPAQVFVSANSGWMDVLERDGELADGTRRDLLGNRLVLIAPRGSAVKLTLAPDTDLVAAIGQGRLAMALVDAVPAGIYGQAALRALGLWDQVSDRIAQTDNVRAALRLVALGEAPLGIVYATDAAADPRVRVVDTFDASLHPAIVYPAAILQRGDSAAARAFFGFLTGSEAGAMFRAHGFGAARSGA